MKGYKGFEPGLICRGKQYAENTVFEEEEAEICSYGMHFCENPFDVLDYYGFTNDMAVINEQGEAEYVETVPETGEVIETEEVVESVTTEQPPLDDFSSIMEG